MKALKITATALFAGLLYFYFVMALIGFGAQPTATALETLANALVVAGVAGVALLIAEVIR